MSEFFVFITATLAVLGAVSMLYCLLEWLLRPKEQLPLLLLGQPRDAASLLRLCDHVRSLRRRGWDARLLIPDGCLDEEAARIAAILARDDAGVELWRMEDFIAYAERTAGGANPFSHL